tara:strand:- start:56 stop:1024 length:969 start_codon:yes stop_codon:yes gene_type:complete
LNSQQLKEFETNVPDFLGKECFLVDPAQLVYDKNNSQIRANGHVASKYGDYAELLKKGVNFPPISVRRMPNGKWQLKEGCTRAGGAALAGMKVLATDYQDRVLGWGAPEWEDFQAQANDHPNASPNTIADIEHFIDRQVKNGNLEMKLGYKYDGNEERFVEEAAKHYRKEIYKNCGKDLDFFRRKVKKALLGKVRSNYENYSKEGAMDFYRAVTGFAGARAGDVSNGEVVYTFKQANHTSPAMVGHVASKLMDNPGIKVTIIYHVGDLVGKDDKKIKAERLKIESWFDKVNSHYGWFDALYFLPQIKQGPNKENLYKLIKSR